MAAQPQRAKPVMTAWQGVLAGAVILAAAVMVWLAIQGAPQQPAAAGSAGQVAIVTQQCWSGSIGSASHGQHSVSGCGNQRLSVPVAAGPDAMSAVIQLQTDTGVLAVGVNCGQGMQVQQTSAPYGVASATCTK